MTVYRLPFDDDGNWTFAGLGNWDDPKTGPHQPYAFDFSHPIGGIVRAARGGEVVFVSNIAGNTNVDKTVPGYGTAVLIRHVDNTVAAYNHLKFQSLKVVMHQRVLQGQALGLSGNTGHSSAPHLHFGGVSFWNSAEDQGADFPMQFEDKHHGAWRPMIGDVVAPTNSGFREEEWRWCAKCHGLYFSGTPDLGPLAGTCPSGGSHAHGGSANYLLTVNSNVAGQKGWRRCGKCQGLFFSGNPGSHCPAGGAHSMTGSGDVRGCAQHPDGSGPVRLALVQQVSRSVLRRQPGLDVSRRPRATHQGGERELHVADDGRGRTATGLAAL